MPAPHPGGYNILYADLQTVKAVKELPKDLAETLKKARKEEEEEEEKEPEKKKPEKKKPEEKKPAVKQTGKKTDEGT